VSIELMTELGVVIGVTGHRVLTDLPSLERGVKEAISRIEEVFPGQPLSVLSALAEGSDRLVVDEVLRRPNARLLVVLPLPGSDCELDFGTDESRKQFRRLLGKADQVVELPAHATRTAAYEAVGDHVLDHSDVLVTLWDGRVEQGRGGTGAIVAEARVRGLPLAWIHAGNRRPGTMAPTSLGDGQGTVTFENL
jgi:hypothetical protein